jgi:ElaB/YqjD/DUF883 family membrane-anchored ribosome-binding protein
VSYDVSAEIADIVSRTIGSSSPVAKKRSASRSHRRATSASASKSKEVTDAASSVDEARDKLQQAEENYRRVRDEASKCFTQASRMTIGEAIDGSLELVRRHPVGGLCAAGFLGFLVGRILRR